MANPGCRRNFLQRSYPTMKKHNPHTPILIREASGFEPTLFARYSTFRPGMRLEKTKAREKERNSVFERKRETNGVIRVRTGEEDHAERAGRQRHRAEGR